MHETQASFPTNGGLQSPSRSGRADPLTLELLRWIDSRPRTYVEAMEAWRSTCPRHSIWDDACIDGLIQVVNGPDATMRQAAVILTSRGTSLLKQA